MIKSDPYAFATLAAEQIVKGLGIATLPVDPIKIARERGIEVVAKPMENEGVSGMLVRYGNEFAIAYATHHENEGFENFSIAHELGHYFLPGHVEAVIVDDNGSHVSRAEYSSGDKYEAEAGLGRYGKTLTVLHEIDMPDAEDEESEQSLIESWTPRFKHK